MTRRRALAAALTLGLVALVVACGADDGDGRVTDPPLPPTTPAETTTAVKVPTTEAPPPTTGDVAPTTTVPPTTAAPTTTVAPADPAAVTLALEPVAELVSPLALTVHERFGDRLFVAERPGRVIAVDPDGSTTELLDLTDQVTTGGERGLLGLAFDLAGAHLYLSYSGPSGQTRIDEVAVDDAGRPDPESRRRVFELPQPFRNHNGGDIAFGPDGHLYLALGDGGSADDPGDNGQDPTTLLGSVLRLAPRGADDAPYAVPADNPFVGTDNRPEIWLYGVRNPWRMSFDRATGDLWIADVGQGQWEEINRLTAAQGTGRSANLGWSAMEGFDEYLGTEPPDHAPPLYTYPHDGRCSVTGGYVYRGRALPELVGAYLYGDYCDGRLRALVVDDAGQATSFDLEVEVGGGELVSFGQDVAGELYVLTLSGDLFRIVPA